MVIIFSFNLLSDDSYNKSPLLFVIIFDGNDLDMGNVLKVKINSSNQNTLFGKSLENSEQRVA